jgi:hypothetical protein
MVGAPVKEGKTMQDASQNTVVNTPKPDSGLGSYSHAHRADLPGGEPRFYANPRRNPVNPSTMPATR